MIFQNSRYSNSPILKVKLASGSFASAVYYSEYPMSFQYQQYVTKDGDRFDLLAFRYLGDSTKWWVIAEANPEVFYPDDIPVGTLLRVPVNG